MLFSAAAPSILLSSEREEGNRKTARKKPMNCKLIDYASRTDEENCKKLLEAQADPNWENENGITALTTASAQYMLNKNQKTYKLWQLLEKEANVREKELSFIKLIPSLLKFFHTHSKYQLDEKQKTRNPWQLLQEANIRKKELSFTKLIPSLLTFFYTQK